MPTSLGWRSRCSTSPTSATTPTPTRPRRSASGRVTPASPPSACGRPTSRSASMPSPAPTSASPRSSTSRAARSRWTTCWRRPVWPSTTAPTRSTSSCPTARGCAATTRRRPRVLAGVRDLVNERADHSAGPGIVKVIIESGELPDQAAIDRATHFAIAHGADFVKTSTGKTPVSATPEAAEIILEAIELSGPARRVQGIRWDPLGRRRPRVSRAGRADHGRGMDLARHVPLRRQRGARRPRRRGREPTDRRDHSDECRWQNATDAVHSARMERPRRRGHDDRLGRPRRRAVRPRRRAHADGGDP